MIRCKIIFIRLRCRLPEYSSIFIYKIQHSLMYGFHQFHSCCAENNHFEFPQPCWPSKRVAKDRRQNNKRMTFWRVFRKSKLCVIKHDESDFFFYLRPESIDLNCLFSLKIAIKIWGPRQPSNEGWDQLPVYQPLSQPWFVRQSTPPMLVPHSSKIVFSGQIQYYM